ncbi:MAG: heme-copper oxidase subunit III [Myxococcales bacterium FL481]|nr:MAG: heme-copper oxidase subunit III [Myxococcales bacterium FL481]
MLDSTAVSSPPIAPIRRQPALPNGVLGMLIFIVTEIMLFAGMISAFMIVRTTANGPWPPPDQPRLPVEATLINTAALLASGVFLFLSHQAYSRGERDRFRVRLLATAALGAFFVLFQGAEWVQLLHQGLTLTSSTHGAFFYLIVGTHAVHAIAAIWLVVSCYLAFLRHELTMSRFGAAQALWYFVVGMWPILYVRVYL